MKVSFKINDIVKNFDEIAKVTGFHEKNLILRPLWNSGMKWLADPAKCELIHENKTKIAYHTNGLVGFAE